MLVYLYFEIVSRNEFNHLLVEILISRNSFVCFVLLFILLANIHSCSLFLPYKFLSIYFNFRFQFSL